MKRNLKELVLTLMLLTLFAITGCGDKKSTEPECMTIDYCLKLDERIDDVCLLDDSILFVTHSGKIGTIALETGAQGALKDAIMGESPLFKKYIDILPDKNYVLECDYAYAEDEYGYVVSKAKVFIVSPEGEILSFLEPDITNTKGMIVDKNGNIVIVSNEALLVMTKEGECVYQTEFARDSAVNIAKDMLGNAMLRIYTDEKSYIRHLDESYSDREPDIYGSFGNGFACCDNKAYFFYDNSLLAFNEADSKLEIVMSLADCGISEKDNKKVLLASVDRIIFLTEMDEIVVAGKSTREDRLSITIGTVHASASLRQYVAKYNREHTDVVVRITEYGNNSVDFLNDNPDASTVAIEGSQLLYRDLLAGNCPDIINVDYNTLSKLADKNIFLDLKPYVDATEKIVLPSKIVSGYSKNERLLSIPNRMKIRTVISIKSDYASKKGYDFMEGNAEEYLQFYFWSTIDEFYDDQKKQFDFSNKEFEDILVKCKERKNQPPREYGIVYLPVDKGCAHYEYILKNTYEIPIVRQALRTSNYSFSGYGEDEKGHKSFLVESDGSYGIYKKSKHSKEAWDFLESFLSDVEATTIQSLQDGIPVNDCARNALYELDSSEYLEQTKKNNVSVSEWNLIYEAGVQTVRPNRKELDVLEKLYQEATVIDPVYNDILEILLEDARAYFADEKSLSEVVPVIQSRVNIYMAEHR